MTRRLEDPMTGEPCRMCDCWICRYEREPYEVGACPHPHYPHSHPDIEYADKKAAYLASLKKDDA